MEGEIIKRKANRHVARYPSPEAALTGRGHAEGAGGTPGHAGVAAFMAAGVCDASPHGLVEGEAAHAAVEILRQPPLGAYI